MMNALHKKNLLSHNEPQIKHISVKLVLVTLALLRVFGVHQTSHHLHIDLCRSALLCGQMVSSCLWIDYENKMVSFGHPVIALVFLELVCCSNSERESEILSFRATPNSSLTFLSKRLMQ